MHADESFSPKITTDSDRVSAAWNFPLFQAIFGRRARRFGYGMQIPDGPLAFKSSYEPVPLTELEEALLTSVAVGITGWHFAIPHTARQKGLSNYSVRMTGRSTPTAAGIGTPEMFYTNDKGTYLVRTRDAPPTRKQEFKGPRETRLVIDRCRALTVKLSDKRLSIPREYPHIETHNQWNANVPGSTLFIPVADVGQQLLSFLAIGLTNGSFLYDDLAKRPAGNLEPYIRSGLIIEGRRLPLTFLEQYVLATAAGELAMMGHNVALALQAMGLGGWLYTGLNPNSIMGAFAAKGIPGFGFRFVKREDWTLPNPVGLDGYYESLCPPYCSNMHEAAKKLAILKFGKGGAYDPATPGPFRDTRKVKESVERHNDEFLGCLGDMAHYVYETYGKFPGTVPTILMRFYVQAQHIDTDFYDAYLGPESYLETHSRHMELWHGKVKP